MGKGGREGVRENRYLLVSQGAFGNEVWGGHGGNDVEQVEVHAEGGAVRALEGGREGGREGETISGMAVS